MKNLYYTLTILILTSILSCCKDESLPDRIIWETPLNQKSLIYDIGLGYPVYNNTVVFHSTPVPWGIHQSILHGINLENGQEKWRLTNSDFSPKKDLQFNNYFYPYQKDKILVGSDCVVKNPSAERYIYGIDIEKGKVLWLTEFPNEYTVFGDMIRGAGQFAYVNAFNENKFSLLKIDIFSGVLTHAFDVVNTDLPEEINTKNPIFFNCFFTSIYQNSDGDDVVACSLSSQYSASPDDLLGTLYVYNLSKNIKLYSTSVSLKEGSNAWINYNDGKILIGKSHTVYCYDAFENKKYWEKSVILNDGVGSGSGNDEIMQVLGYDNLALIYCVDRLVCFDVKTGSVKYNVASSHSSAVVSNGVIYNEDNNDLLFRDVYTGKVLKRVITGKNEEGFAASRPNVLDGKVFIHSYSDAFCIKAWNK